eukprot:gene30760-35798_t
MAGSRPRDGVQLAKREVVIAIDFGTHGTGFAYSTDGGDTVNMHEHYPHQAVPYPKTRTAILYNGRSPVEIGDAALHFADDQRTLLKEFKLGIQDPSACDACPAGLNAVQVAADFLGMFRRYIIQYLREHGLPNGQEQVAWCLTVPAIWSEASKVKMRQAAVRAGLINNLEDDKLSIILEPEAAALKVIRSKATNIQVGDTYMVVDAGGGTTDITIHTVESRGGGELVLAEATHAVGEMVGATTIDTAFMNIYKQKVGEQALNAWKHDHPREYQLVCDKFEAVKRIFTGNDKKALEVEHGSSHNIRLSTLTMKSLFNPLVDSIIDLAKRQLKDSNVAVNKVFLVGGFADSKYFVKRMRQALSADDSALDAVEVGGVVVPVVVPAQPYAAVLWGAVQYGCRPDLISARRSKMSYGIELAMPYKDGDPDKIWHAEKGQFYCHTNFKPFVERNQLIQVNEVVVQYATPLYTETYNYRHVRN